MLEQIKELKKYEGSYTFTHDMLQFNLPNAEDLTDLSGLHFYEKQELEQKMDAFYQSSRVNLQYKFPNVHIQYVSSLGKAYLVTSRNLVNGMIIEKQIKEVKKEIDLYLELSKKEISYIEDYQDAVDNLYGIEDVISETISFINEMNKEIKKLIKMEIQKVLV
jgi:hypothetical protein